jgi:integrase
LALAWDDVDLDDGILRVRRTVQRLRGQGLVFGPLKSTRSRRSIPLPESSRAAMLSHRERQEAERLTAGDSWHESGLVFTTAVSTVVEPRNLSRTFEQLVQQSGVRRIRFHDLRHTCASLLLAQGVSPRVVMDVLGHSQLSITMDLYSPCHAECLARRRRRDGSGAERTSTIVDLKLIVDRCCHRCCQSWFDGDL